MGHFSPELYIVRYNSISVFNWFPLYKKFWIPDLLTYSMCGKQIFFWTFIFVKHHFSLFGHCLITKRKCIFQYLELAKSLGMAAYSGCEPELQLKRRCPEYATYSSFHSEMKHADLWACQGWRSSVRNPEWVFLVRKQN